MKPVIAEQHPLYMYLLFVVLVLYTEGQIAKWLASLRCLRALPWTPNRLTWFILCSSVFELLVVLASGFAALAIFGTSPSIAWMALALIAPIFGLLLSPRTGAGLFVAIIPVGVTLVFVLDTKQSVMPWLLLLAIGLLIASAYRLRALIHSTILYRERAMEFLVPGQRR